MWAEQAGKTTRLRSSGAYRAALLDTTAGAEGPAQQNLEVDGRPERVLD